MHSWDFIFLSETNLLGLSIKSYESLAWRLQLFGMSIVQCWYTDSYIHSCGHIVLTRTLITNYCISETNARTAAHGPALPTMLLYQTQPCVWSFLLHHASQLWAQPPLPCNFVELSGICGASGTHQAWPWIGWVLWACVHPWGHTLFWAQQEHLAPWHRPPPVCAVADSQRSGKSALVNQQRPGCTGSDQSPTSELVAWHDTTEVFWINNYIYSV